MILKKVTIAQAHQIKLWEKCKVFLEDYQIKNIELNNDLYTLEFFYSRADFRKTTVTGGINLDYDARQLLWSDEPIDHLTDGHKNLYDMFLEITGKPFDPTCAIKIIEETPDNTYYFEGYVVERCPDGDYIYQIMPELKTPVKWGMGK
jgi:hypothetical protein